MQASTRPAGGRIERFGPIVSTGRGRLSGIHWLYLTVPGDVVRFLEVAFATGVIVSNGHISWWYRVPAAANEEARRAVLACAALLAPRADPMKESVMVQVGLAMAWGKPVFLFRDDFAGVRTVTPML